MLAADVQGAVFLVIFSFPPIKNVLLHTLISINENSSYNLYELVALIEDNIPSVKPHKLSSFLLREISG